MNNITVGAIQISLPYPSPEFEFLNDNYCGDIEHILKHFVEPRIEKNVRFIKEAAKKACKIVTTAEHVTGMPHYLTDIREKSDFKELVKRSAELADKAFSAVAAECEMYVIACYHHTHGDKIVNRASLFDTKGDLFGYYDKTQLPANEEWQVTAGTEIPVFDLPFGRVGICICYEMMFPEIMGVLSLKGAEIVFHPTAGYGWYDSIGEATLRTRANDSDCYLVTAKNFAGTQAGRSSVIDFWGQIKADAGFDEDVVVTHTIDLSRKKCQPDWFIPTRMINEANIRERRKLERRPALYAPLIDNNYKNEKNISIEEKNEILSELKSGKIHW